MTTETDRVFAELSDMLRAVAESLLPGEEITMETTLIDDLGLDSLSIANLTGRVQSRYGSKASLLPFFADREAGPFQELRVGELVGYLTGVLAANGPAPADPPAAGAAGGRRGRGRSENAPDTVPASRNGRRPKNDNTGVLAELAPDTVRRLVRLQDGQVEVFTAGDGPTLVLMHPINVGAGVFARQLAALSGDYQVICAHNPGVGATTWDADVSLPGLARPAPGRARRARRRAALPRPRRLLRRRGRAAVRLVVPGRMRDSHPRRLFLPGRCPPPWSPAVVGRGTDGDIRGPEGPRGTGRRRGRNGQARATASPATGSCPAYPVISARSYCAARAWTRASA